MLTEESIIILDVIETRYIVLNIFKELVNSMITAQEHIEHCREI